MSMQEDFYDEDEAPEPTYSRFVVAVFLEDRAYGGPEEGGWWYNCGEFVRTIKVFRNEDKACDYANRMNGKLHARFNRYRRSPSSVLSEGHFRASVWGDRVPKYFPQRTPHYE